MLILSYFLVFLLLLLAGFLGFIMCTHVFLESDKIKINLGADFGGSSSEACPFYIYTNFFLLTWFINKVYINFLFTLLFCIATAKSLQSHLTLCDGRPPGSPIPGILQARTLEWVAISFSNV